MDKGHFISVEGIDGSGKSTLIQSLAQWLEERDYPVTLTREPGGTPVGEMIRHILLDVDDVEISPMTEMLLFAASRAQHVNQVIAPALQKGYIVLCDRYVDSSIAYQGAARGLGDDDVMTANLLAVQAVMPALTLFLDIDPEEAARRQQQRPEGANRMEIESLAFYRQVRKGFYSLQEKYPDRIVRIDGEKSPDAVYSGAIEVVKRLLK
jgi:dTMP kinase